MSYILEALRRAEAEREREAGKVPTLNTPARTLPLPDDDELAPRRPAGRRWVWPALGAVTLAGAGGWWMLRGGDAPVIAPAPVAAPTVAPVATPAAPPPAAPTIAQAAPSPAPAPAPVVQAAPAPVTKPATVATRPAPPPAAARKPATPPPAAAEAAAPAKPKRFAELTEAQRREIPSLTFGGSMHSPDPAARMVIVNGQVRREGETVAPGLVLEQIGVRSAVFAFKGIRFEMPL